MKLFQKKLLKRIASMTCVIALLAGLIVSADVFYPDSARAATTTSSAIGTSGYLGTIGTSATFTAGTTYTLSGLGSSAKGTGAVYLGQSDGIAYFQSTGLYGAAWTTIGTSAMTLSTTYWGNFYRYNAVTKAYLPRVYYSGTIYSSSDTEYLTSTPTGIAYYNGSSWVYDSTISNYMKTALISAANNYSSLGASGSGAWLGAANDSRYAWNVDSNGVFNSSNTSGSYVVAPCFTIDLSKVYLSGTTMTATDSTDSTAITATLSSDTVEDETTVNLSSLISSVKYDDGYNSGKSAAYTVTVDEAYGTISGRTWTIPSFSGIKSTATLTITETGSGQSLSTTAEVTITQNTDTEDNVSYTGSVDDNGFVSYTENGIEWHYLVNNDGYIDYLYTTDKANSLVSNGTLIVPSAINGVPVRGIGGGVIDESYVPFIPVDTNYSKIYFPNCVTTINDGAFINISEASSITIPDNITTIGTKAFFNSSIKSLVIESKSTAIKSYAFAYTKLKTVKLKSGTISLGKRCLEANDRLTSVIINNATNVTFGYQCLAYNTALTKLNIPITATINDDTYALKEDTALTTLTIDVPSVGSNFAYKNTSLSSVTFGEDVTNVAYDWAGTATTCERTTYVLSKSTKFGFYCSDSKYYSAFGDTGASTVYCPSISDTEYADNTSADTKDDSNLISNIVFVSGKYEDDNTTYMPFIKGQADSITITANSTYTTKIIEQTSTTQEGIEASYSGSVYYNTSSSTGNEVKKDNMSVAVLYDDSSNGGTYSDFYILRTDNVSSIINTNYDSDEEAQAALDEANGVTVTSSDLVNGFVKVTVIVSKSATLTGSRNGTIYINDSEGSVDTSLSGTVYTANVTIPVVEYTAAQDFADNYGSYAAVLAEITSLNEEVEELTEDLTDAKATVTSLTTTNATLTTELKEAQATVDSLTEELEAATTAYAELVEEVAALTNATATTSASDYTYTDSDTDTTYVIIGSEDVAYDTTTATTVTIDGEEVVIYKTTATGATDSVWFYVDNDGVHVVTVNDTDSPTEVTDIEDVDSDTITILQRKIAAELVTLRAALSDAQAIANAIVNAIDDLIASIEGLGITVDVDEDATYQEKLDAILAAITELKESYESLSANYDEIVSAIYDSNDTVDISSKSVSDIITQLDALSGDTDAIAEQIQKALTGEDVDSEDLKTLTELLSEIEEMASDLTAKTSLLQKIMDALEVTDSASILQAIADLQSQVSTAYQTGYNAGYTAGYADGAASATSATTSGTTTTTATDPASASTISSLNSTISTLTAANSTLTTQNATLMAENESLTEVLEDAAEDVSDITDTLTDATASSSSTKSSVKAASAEGSSSALAYAIKSLKSAAKSIVKAYDSASDDVSDLTSANNTLTSKNKSLSSKNSTLKTKNSTLKSKNSTLKTKNSTLKTKNSSLKSQVSSLKSQLKSAKRSNSSSNLGGSTYSGGTTYTGSTSTSSSTTSDTVSSSDNEDDKNDVDSGFVSMDDVENANNENNEDNEDKEDEEIKVTAISNIPDMLGETISLPENSDISDLTDSNVSAFSVNSIYSSEGDVDAGENSVGETSDESKSNANAILSYYASNLDRLAALNDSSSTLTQVTASIGDDSNLVNINAVTSLDVIATDEQKEAIENGETVNVSISSTDFADGTYLVIHESEEREGEYDIYVVEASNNTIDLELQDLSPISIASITVDPVAVTTPDGIEETTAVDSSAKMKILYIAGIAIVLALVIGGVVLIRRRNSQGASAMQ